MTRFKKSHRLPPRLLDAGLPPGSILPGEKQKKFDAGTAALAYLGRASTDLGRNKRNLISKVRLASRERESMSISLFSLVPRFQFLPASPSFYTSKFLCPVQQGHVLQSLLTDTSTWVTTPSIPPGPERSCAV